MSSGPTASPRKLTPKPGGDPKVLFTGVALVAAGFGLFYYSQFYIHKRDDQTYIQRQNMQVDDKNSNTRIVDRSPETEPRPASKNIPTTSNTK